MRTATGITAKTDELKRLIAEHPDYNICVLMEDGAASDDYAWTYASDMRFGIQEILNSDTLMNQEVIFAQIEMTSTKDLKNGSGIRCVMI